MVTEASGAVCISDVYDELTDDLKFAKYRIISIMLVAIVQ